MKTITVQHNQSMMDVIIQACGTLEEGMNFCLLNGVAITDAPTVGAVYNVPDQISSDGKATLKLLATRRIVIGTLGLPIPGTGIVTEDELNLFVSETGDTFLTE